MRRFALVFAVCACSTVQLGGPSGSRELDEIADLEDRRVLGDGRLVLLALTANDPAVRARGLLALGRLQEPSTAEAVVKGLSDPDVNARLQAAFGIGLFGLSWEPLSDEVKATLSQGLLAAEADQDELPKVKLALLDAMGRVASADTLNRLIDRLADASPDVRAHSAVALGVAVKAVKASLPARAVGALIPLLHKDVPQAVRFGGAYGLAMSKDPASRAALLECVHDEASEVRAVCARGLIEVGTEAEVAGVKPLLDDPDYRVSVEAARMLAKVALKCKTAECPALTALEDLSVRADRLLNGDSVGGAQPLLALAQIGLPPAGQGVLISLRRQLGDGFEAVRSPLIKSDVANIDCRLAAAIDRLGGQLVNSLTCGFGLVPEARRLAVGLQELGHGAPPADPEKRVNDVKDYASHSSNLVRQAALDLLGATKSELAMPIVRAQIKNDDLIVAATAAGAAGELKDRQAIPEIRALVKRAKPDVAPTLAAVLAELEAKDAVPDLQPWLTSPYANIRAATAAALSKLMGQVVVAPPYTGTSPRRAKSTAEGEDRLTVKTLKGQFVITLDVARAPVTSANMISLAKKGYFNNITFHRIVPGFVAQAGDPRGDGEGGPGYAIRCELNQHAYTRLAVGMALSGKDTGGSQFFVTTAAQPHLDGRYTVFGDVTSGQELIDSLLEGDLILSVTATDSSD